MNDAHDPLCLWSMDVNAGPCQCVLIAKVRHDERRRVEMAGVIDREVIADEIEAILIPRKADLPAGEYGPLALADWMRQEAARIARGAAS